MSRRSNLSRWYSGYVRERNEARLKRYRSPVAKPLQLACKGLLWLYMLFLTVLLASCIAGTPAHAQTIPRDAQRYQLTLKREARMVWGLDAPVAAFAGQVHQESHWRVDARSQVGAVGLAQFMPSTSNWIGGLYPSLADRAPTNPTWALRGLVSYDKWLFDRITADDACQRMAFALSAYNGGLGWVYKRQKVSTSPGVCFDATCAINPGIAPASQRENQHYPEVILLTNESIYSLWGPGACP